MDKYEYKLKLDQMKTLVQDGDYTTAAQIADSINWRKVKNINLLMKAGDVYYKLGRYDEAKEVLLMAYDRSPIGRMIIYRLAAIAIKMKNFEEAEEYYDEFAEIAPHDNLKLVLRYKISKAKGTDIRTQIAILEELKEVEYTEEWGYELAYLYHKAGEIDKCIDACDELILWFGDGIYVERALDLKMMHQPLTKAQENKYRELKQKRDGVKEIYFRNPQEEAADNSRFDTANLQEELAKSMQQIMNATEKETVDDTMNSIKKIVEEVPYLQQSFEEPTGRESAVSQIQEEHKIDQSIRSNFREILAEEQPTVPEEADNPESGIKTQTSIDDVLSEWEKTKRAAEAALEMADRQKLESAKAKALQEAGDIMERLSDVIPRMETVAEPQSCRTGTTETAMAEENPSANMGNLPEEEAASEENAGRIMENVNHALQREIDRLQEAETNEHELLRKIRRAKPNYDEQIGIRPYVPDQLKQQETASEEELPEIDMSDIIEPAGGYIGEPEDAQKREAEETAEPETEEIPEEELPEIDMSSVTEDIAMSEGSETEAEPDTDPQTDPEWEEEQEAESRMNPEWEEEQEAESRMNPEWETDKVHPQTEEAGQGILQQDTKEIRTEQITEALGARIAQMQEEEEGVAAGEHPSITSLNDEQKTIFSYFVPVAGMEQQICQVLTGASERLLHASNSATGNILIQGGRGCGKTVLATGLIKALQKEIKRPVGKIGKIDAQVLNRKDVAALLKKVSGGCLIIERAGEISRETAVKLSLLLESDSSGLLVIMEDTRVGLEQAMSQDESFAAKFTERIKIPVFTSDELVAFGKAYAHDLNYEIDAMGVLALYNRISNIQRLDRATTLTEVKEIIDGAIEKAEKKSITKAISILTSRRYTEDDYVILREKDFEE